MWCSINGSVCLVCCVLDSVCVNGLVKQFAIYLGVVAILLFVECYGMFSVGEGALFDRPCIVFQRMCVVCL